MTSSEFVMLRGGLALPLAAVQLALTFEERGIHLGIDGDRLAVGPRDKLTDEDRAQIRRWRQHLIAIAAYEADVHWEVVQ